MNYFFLPINVEKLKQRIDRVFILFDVLMICQNFFPTILKSKIKYVNGFRDSIESEFVRWRFMKG